MPSKIKKISALEILDSRGNPTIEVTVELTNKMTATAAVPSGASTGRFEACELRDNNRFRYQGKGVLKAVENVNKILNKELNGLQTTEQKKIDELMIEIDGTKNKSRLGANAILGVSLAVAKAAAQITGLPLYEYLRNLYEPKLKKFNLPTPVVNVINGGRHADTNINLQEFWIAPIRAETFADKLRQASEIFHKLGDLLQATGLDTDLGNEGGYAPDFKSHHQVLGFLQQAVENSGYKPGQDIVFGLDAGASELYNETKGIYKLDLEQEEFQAEELMDYYLDLMAIYPLQFLEDPFAEDDWPAWQQFTKDQYVVSHQIKVIGDDLFVTKEERLKKGIDLSAANAIIIKPNQVGTLTETLATVRLAQQNKYKIIVSHRSGETSDTTIADLAVAVDAEYIKTGSTARGERIAKYNRLLNIEEKIK
ncbi:MAG: phosphopyruvate hydratase [Candidatus Komeilibacteria bacterium CG11_big_fil_rev_8_21_14_0_20_36_20]|uniref:Enolase n=1 Tax=Candidatus Komeilibacteria bacterium CG11_big_fil_rev_8_21_14_0_20_36_20 TaxID=1974477 RepID=A0A2H0NE91_9BACT|nr:MAG: phosphopyruvate hydratase [Candidatus Komeilibacteria bacterium CG11_big_fil_rev_8_21_14_0_20_36_20]PIR81665.1 MAG: phosphopyruvate hydratase [Candidatus Komeilibacteria bacterium CG10_big_fil_rev_8_21_14_0_10_36_65]PJC55596.1 MAG: phosphopyruvate hydratase [Candidatus Komeilibacteria bacterium CG_4_9_14_0_2_um_filter_36_13]